MQEIQNATDLPGDDITENERQPHPDEDGRNKEWQDRARVNLEEVPEGTHTSVERDFEPENLEEEHRKNKKEIPPAY